MAEAKFRAPLSDLIDLDLARDIQLDAETPTATFRYFGDPCKLYATRPPTIEDYFAIAQRVVSTSGKRSHLRTNWYIGRFPQEEFESLLAQATQTRDGIEIVRRMRLVATHKLNPFLMRALP